MAAFGWQRFATALMPNVKLLADAFIGKAF
jgi:hypothetical protein